MIIRRLFDGTMFLCAPSIFSEPVEPPEVAAARTAAARKALEEAEARAEASAKLAAEAPAKAGAMPEERDIEVMEYGRLKTVKGRNRTFRENFDDMAKRFLGSIDKFGNKTPGELESGDAQVRQYARDMLTIMAIADGAANVPFPNDVIALDA